MESVNRRLGRAVFADCGTDLEDRGCELMVSVVVFLVAAE